MCLIRAAEPKTAEFNLFQYILSNKKKTLQLPYFPPKNGETSEIPLKATARTTLVRKPFGEAGFGRITDDDLRCLVPCGAGSKGGFDLSDQGIVDDHARFEVQRLDLKNTLLAVEPFITTRFRPIKEGDPKGFPG